MSADWPANLDILGTPVCTSIICCRFAFKIKMLIRNRVSVQRGGRLTFLRVGESFPGGANVCKGVYDP